MQDITSIVQFVTHGQDHRESLCPECNGLGYVSLCRDFGGIFRTIRFKDQCADCLGTGIELDQETRDRLFERLN